MIKLCSTKRMSAPTTASQLPRVPMGAVNGLKTHAATKLTAVSGGSISEGQREGADGVVGGASSTRYSTHLLGSHAAEAKLARACVIVRIPAQDEPIDPFPARWTVQPIGSVGKLR